VHFYKDEWVRCRSVDEISAVDDLYVLAVLGSATVCSNLGLHEEAAIDLRSHVAAWSAQARLHAKSLLFTDKPGRFLSADYVETLPARTIIDLMDYAYDEERGIEWLDALRVAHARNVTVLESLTPLAPVRLQRLGSNNEIAGKVALANTLRARSALLDANSAHYDFLKAKDTSAIAFQRALESARIDADSDAICVSATA